MVFLLPLGVMAHNHMVKHLLKVVMELHLLQVAMEGLLLLVVMVCLLVVMEVRLLQEDMEGILLQVDMGHNLPQLDMDPTLDISPHNRTIAHKVHVFPQKVFIHLIYIHTYIHTYIRLLTTSPKGLFSANYKGKDDNKKHIQII